MNKRIVSAAMAFLLAFSVPTGINAANSYVKSMVLDFKETDVEVNDLDSVDAEVKVVGDASYEVTATSSDEKLLKITELEPDPEEPGLTSIWFETFDYQTDEPVVITITTVGKGQDGKPLTGYVKVNILESVPEEPEDPDLEFDDDVSFREDGEHEEEDGSITIVETADDGTQTQTNTSADGKVETVTIIYPNNDFVKTTVTTDGKGNVLKTSISSQTTDSEGNITLAVQEIRADNSSDSATYTKDKDGLPLKYVTESVDKDGNSVTRSYNLRKNAVVGPTTGLQPSGADVLEATFSGGASTDNITNVPSTITLFATGETCPVTTIEANSIKTNKVYFGENVTKIETGAFDGSGTTSINFRGPVTKSMFDKNALKGAGKKKGKGLFINVPDKKSAKAMNKAKKKAGVKKAKVNYRLK